MLYLLETIDTRLSETQLLRVISDNDWMNYFDYELSLKALEESHMLEAEPSINGVFYTITDIGRQTLSYFEKDLPYSLREAVRAYCKAHRDELVLEARLFGESLRLSDSEYLVRLRILEKNATVFELSLIAGSKEEATHYVENWKRRAQDIFKMSYEMLVK